MTLKILLGIVGYFWGGWALYVLVMGIFRLHLAKKLNKAGYVLGAPFMAIGLVLNFLGNITICALLFLDPPRELFISRRLKRYVRTRTDWRHKVAVWVCQNALDPYDAKDGDHC